jgi:hypothetical protein
LNAGEGGTATGSFLREIVVARGLVGWPQEGHGGDKAWLRRFVAVVCPGWRCENNGPFALVFDFQPSMNMLVFRFAAGQAPGGRVAQQTVVWQAKRGRGGHQESLSAVGYRLTGFERDLSCGSGMTGAAVAFAWPMR